MPSLPVPSEAGGQRSLASRLRSVQLPVGLAWLDRLRRRFWVHPAAAFVWGWKEQQEAGRLPPPAEAAMAGPTSGRQRKSEGPVCGLGLCLTPSPPCEPAILVTTN